MTTKGKKKKSSQTNKHQHETVGKYHGSGLSATIGTKKGTYTENLKHNGKMPGGEFPRKMN